MSFIVATNVVASQPPEWQPTGTPDARAKIDTVWQTVNNVCKRMEKKRILNLQKDRVGLRVS